MIARLFAQAILATSLLNLVPADAGVIENRAMLPQASDRNVATILDGFSMLSNHLPMAADIVQPPKKIDQASLGVVTSAVSALIVDRASGQVLFQKNTQEPRSIGSITKLMTALIFLEGKPDFSALAAIEPSDVRIGGVQHIQVGDQISVRNLFEASLVGSDNSATAALVRLSGMPVGDFVARMNEKAAYFGMRATTFFDPTGLSADNRSVVDDLARLIDETMKIEEIREATEMPMVSFTGVSGRKYNIESTNELLGSFLNLPPFDIVGGKTGFLPEAGYCFGAIFSEHNTHELIIIVLGSDTEEGRFKDAKGLAAWAYKVFAWPDELVMANP